MNYWFRPSAILKMTDAGLKFPFLFFLKNQIEVSELIGCRVGTKNSGSFFFRVKKSAILFLPEAGMAIGYCNY